MPSPLALNRSQKREVLRHLSREKKVELQERIYNDHRSAPFSRALWLVCTTKVYSGLGADIVMESLHSLTPVKRQI